MGEKKDIYGEAGIREYWIVNLKSLQLQVFRDLDNGRYKTELTITTGTIISLSFPDISVRIGRLMG